MWWAGRVSFGMWASASVYACTGPSCKIGCKSRLTRGSIALKFTLGWQLCFRECCFLFLNVVQGRHTLQID